MIRSLIAALLIATMLLTGCGDTTEKEFYAGKTVFVYVGRPPGSGADLAVRSFVRFWQEQIPGQPTMVVKNVPGGAGDGVCRASHTTAPANAIVAATHIRFRLGIRYSPRGAEAAHEKMGRGGLEPPTPAFSVRCSTN